jgi:hypothetical protein
MKSHLVVGKMPVEEGWRYKYIMGFKDGGWSPSGCASARRYLGSLDKMERAEIVVDAVQITDLPRCQDFWWPSP